MKKHMLAAMSTALILMFAAVTFTNAAQDAGPSAPAGAPAVTGAMSHSGGPSEEFGKSFHHRHSLEAMLKKLGITDEQKKQMRLLYAGFHDRTRKARMELMSLKDEKKTMLLSGKIDQQKLAQIDDQIVKLKSEVMKERLKLRRDRLGLMTPEQIDKLADWMAKKSFRAKLKGMHGCGKMRSFHG